MKKFALLSAIGLMAMTLVSCEETSLIPDGQVIDERNVETWIYTYWEGDAFYFDTVYNTVGGEILIEDITLVYSNYEFSLSTNDTVDADTSFCVADLRTLKHKLGVLPGGNYSGEHQILLGYDSLTYYTPVTDVPSVLTSADIARPNFGYNHLVVRGMYKPEGDTINALPAYPFEWKLAGQDYNILFEKPMNFSVTANNPVTIFFNFNIDGLFGGDLVPQEVPIIISDPNNNDDVTAATQLFTNLEASLHLD